MTHYIFSGQTPRAAFIRIFGGAALAFGLFLGLAAEAPAQTVCLPHTEVAKQLGSLHSEAPVAIGLANDGNVVEVFSTGDGSTWTIVVTMPSGKTCLVAAGEGWETLTKIALGPQA